MLLPFLLSNQIVEDTLLSILHRITPEDITNAAKAVWQDPATAEKIAVETLEIMTKASKQKFSFFNGKTSKSLVGGLFYILGYKHDAAKTQKQLALKLHTTDTTIRHSARKWLQEFPELFPDAINKLWQNKKNSPTAFDHKNEGNPKLWTN